MQTLTKCTVAALLAAGTNAIVANVNGTTSANVNNTLDETFTLGVATYNNGTALALKSNLYLNGIVNANVAKSNLWTQLNFLSGASASPVSGTDAVLCTIAIPTSTTTATTAVSCDDGYYNTALAYTTDGTATGAQSYTTGTIQKIYPNSTYTNFGWSLERDYETYVNPSTDVNFTDGQTFNFGWSWGYQLQTATTKKTIASGMAAVKLAQIHDHSSALSGVASAVFAVVGVLSAATLF